MKSLLKYGLTAVFALVFGYVGGNYLGWDKAKVQESAEKAAEQVVNTVDKEAQNIADKKADGLTEAATADSAISK